MLGVVEHPALGDTPYRVDADGHPYLPAGDGGLVLGVRLGDPVSAVAGDHVAPGACLVHPEPPPGTPWSATRASDPAEVRTGRATGARGAVIGKRGEDGRLITGFRQEDLARMRPGDHVTVRTCGQGWQHPRVPPGVMVMNAGPGLLDTLPVAWPGDGPMTVGVLPPAQRTRWQRHRQARRRVGPGPAASGGPRGARRRRPAAGQRRTAARGPGGGHRPGCQAQHGVPEGLADHRCGAYTAPARCPGMGPALPRSSPDRSPCFQQWQMSLVTEV